MNERDVEKLVTDSSDAWRVASERTDAQPTATPSADVPEHIRKDCAARAPGCTPRPDGRGGWQYERADRRDGTTGETVQRFADGELRHG